MRKEVTCPKRQLPVLRNVLSSSSSRSSEEKWEITNKKLRRKWGEAMRVVEFSNGGDKIRKVFA